jgi:hypothetical protein
MTGKIEKFFDKVVDVTAGSYKLGRRTGKRVVRKFSE